MKQKQHKAEIIIQDIPLNLIDTEGQSVRDQMDNDHVVELAMSISKHGLLQPIVVDLKEDGRYQLDAGFHRLSAFHRLNRQTIPANVRQLQTGTTKAIALIENIVRRDMTLTEEVTAVNYLNKHDNMSTTQICDLLGKSTEWVNKRLMIPGLPEDVKADLLSGVISIRHAEIIGAIENEGIRATVLNATIQNRFNTRQTSDFAKLYMETPSMESAIQKGIETAQAIQAQKTPTRSCDYCGSLTELSQIMFVATCPACLNKVEQAVNQFAQKEGEDNGDRTGTV